MTDLPTLDENSAMARARVGNGRLAVEILVWIAAFSLLLCVPTDRPSGAKRAAGATALSAEKAR